jgi:hypothetical protein
MCYSAHTRFISGGGLALLGTASLLSVRKKDKVLGAMPLFFGIQQTFEGLQWLYLEKGYISTLAGLAPLELRTGHGLNRR